MPASELARRQGNGHLAQVILMNKVHLTPTASAPQSLVSSARPRSRLAGTLLAAVWALQTGAGSLAPAVALAGPAEESKAINAKGAAQFKKGEYLDAAQAFEKAYALDQRDFRVLRYAGRAWQEIGHLERALTLLERYYSLETEPDLKASILGNLEKLRKSTPEERADALDKGCAKYPQAKLEVEAARALEALGYRLRAAAGRPAL